MTEFAPSDESREDLARAIETAQHPHHVSEIGPDALDQHYLVATVAAAGWVPAAEYRDHRITELRDHLRHAAVAFSVEGTALRDRAERAEAERDAALAVIEKAPHGRGCGRFLPGTEFAVPCNCWKSSVDTSALAAVKADAVRGVVEAVRYSGLLWMPEYIRFIEDHARALAEGGESR